MSIFQAVLIVSSVSAICIISREMKIVLAETFTDDIFYTMKMETSGFESKKIKTNQEIVAETKKEYPKFKDFWDDVLKQSNEGACEIASTNNPVPLNIVRLFASKLATIRQWNDLYISGTDGLEENPKAEMPVIVYKNCMNILQRAMGEASDFYHAETEILNEDGTIKH